MLDNLPIKPFKNECGIVNLDSTDGNGTHWVAYKKKDKQVIYFDSFGNLKPPIEIVKYFQKNNIKYNYTKYQQYDTYICGHLCLKFLYNQL